MIPGDERNSNIHPRAEVHADCRIGARTKVWQFASVIRGAQIGADCTIASCALIDGAQLGDRVIVGHGSAIEPGVRLRHDVFVGPNVTFCNDAWPRVAKAGFDMKLILSGEIIVTEVEDGASIGAGAIVLPGVTVMVGAMVAAGAVVDRDVHPFSLFKRNGSMVAIDPKRTDRRMRVVRRGLPVGA